MKSEERRERAHEDKNRPILYYMFKEPLFAKIVPRVRSCAQRSLYVIVRPRPARFSCLSEGRTRYGVAVTPCATAPVSGTAARNLIARWFAARSPSHVLDQRDGFRRLFDIWANSLPRAPRS